MAKTEGEKGDKPAKVVVVTEVHDFGGVQIGRTSLHSPDCPVVQILREAHARQEVSSGGSTQAFSADTWSSDWQPTGPKKNWGYVPPVNYVPPERQDKTMD